MTRKTVDEYIAGLDGWKAETVTGVRQIILEAAPDSTESIKWSQPVYESNGPFCYMNAFKNSMNFCIWRGVDIEDPDGLLQGSGDKMRHFKIASVDDVNEKVYTNYVKQAVNLN